MCEKLSVDFYGKGQVFLWASSKTRQPLKPFFGSARLFPTKEKALFSFYQHLLVLSFFKLLFKVTLKEERLQNLFLSWPCCRQITSLLSFSVFYIIKLGIVIARQVLGLDESTHVKLFRITIIVAIAVILLFLLENSHVADPHTSCCFH